MSNKIFIPLTLDGSEKAFIDDKQALILILSLAIFLIGSLVAFVVYAKNKGLDILGTPLFMIAAEILCIFIPLRLIRIYVIQETLLKEMCAEVTKHEITSPAPFCSAVKIRDSHIYFLNGYVGVLLECNFGSTIGRSDDIKAIHRAKRKTVLARLAADGMIVKYYNRVELETNEEPLLKSESELIKTGNGPLEKLFCELSQYFRAVSHLVAYVKKDYYLIISPSFDRTSELDNAIKFFIDALRGGMYQSCRPLDGIMVNKFMEKYYGLDYFSFDDCMDERFDFSDQELVKVVKIIYYNDSEEIAPKCASKSIENAIDVVQEDISDQEREDFLQMFAESREV